ncbi:MAG: Hsp20/alpha crystallin family protein [Longimicrobiales bacterium]|nr:Hsp20/alpha crystallin family protein [Longimicrobiales bacterium]
MTKRKAVRQKPSGGQGDVGAGIFGSLTEFVETLGEMTSAGKQRLRRGGHSEEEDGSAAEGPAAGNQFSRILAGLAGIAEKLNEISEEGETLSKEGKFAFPSKEGGVKGVYGFSLRTGLSGKDDQIRVEPFGNIRKDKETGEAVVQEISEPLVDVFEDEDSTTLVAEMPGIGQEDISVDVLEDILTIQAQKGEKKYRKEILLRHRTTKEGLKVACNNGVVTIRCEKAG